jgi:RNA polymerase II elongation factor ELL
VKDTSTLPPAVQKKGSAQPIKTGKKAKLLAGNNRTLTPNSTRSMPSSPGLSGFDSPSLAPTSIPMSQQIAEKAKTIRKPIVHQLALGPASETELFKFHNDSTVSDQDFRIAIDKVADLENDGRWKLKQKAFKELDVFSYKGYSSQERQTAIDNAIRAYDKLRLNASEPEWDRLLPHNERGTGKILSKLQAKIASGAAKPPKISFQHADESGRDTPIKNSKGSDKDKDDHFNTQPPAAKPKKVTDREAQAKRLLGKGGKKAAPKSTEKKPAERTATESSRIKSSKFVSDSDEEDDYVITPIAAPEKPIKSAPGHSTTAPTKSAKPLPVPSKPATKRVREEPDDLTHAATKKHKGTSPHKSSPLASSPPTNAADISDSSSLSSVNDFHKRSADSFSDAAPEAKRHQKSSSISTTSSDSSGKWSPATQDVLIEKAKKFKVYYQKYAKLHKELSANPNRDAVAMEQLLEMHHRLANLKQEIVAASPSQH